MNLQEEKCVMIIDESLPLGTIANAAAILGITLGKAMPEVVGKDVCDASGCIHKGIIKFPVPILRGNQNSLRQIQEKLRKPGFEDLLVVDFSDLAQSCKTYEDFTLKMSKTGEDALNYIGIAICGPQKKVNKLAGSIGLLR